MLVASVQEEKFCKLRVDALYISSLEGCSLNELQIFFHKRVKYDTVFHSLLIIRTVNLESPKLELLWSIMRKLTPRCRNEGIFADSFRVNFY